MLIQDMIDEGYQLKSWFISSVRGQRLIGLHLIRKSGKNGQSTYNYTSSAPISPAFLKDSHFTIPCLMDNIEVVH